MSAVPTGQTLVADPGPLVSSERGRFEVARPFPTRAQPAPPEPGARTHLEPPDNATRPVARRTRATKLVIDSPFAAVPEWVIDAQISDTALRLYCVLLRYGNTTGHRMPSRATLAARLHKKSTDTIDRALKELEDLGALAVEHRATGTGRALTNRYHLLTASPGASRAIPPRGSRTAAAPPHTRELSPPAATTRLGYSDSRRGAATPGRTGAARMAAGIGQDRKPPTQTPPHPIPSAASPAPQPMPVDGDPTSEAADTEADLLAACGITDLRALIGQLHDHRRRLARPITPWSRRKVLAALEAAVTHHGWPATDAATALLAIAADRTTTSPMRLTAPGPWWNTTPAQTLVGATDDPPVPRPEPAIASRGAQLVRAALRANPVHSSGVGGNHDQMFR